MGEVFTSEEAHQVRLSWNPVKRLGQLAECGAGLPLPHPNRRALPQFLTRGDLVAAAEKQHQNEYNDWLEDTLSWVEGFPEELPEE